MNTFERHPKKNHYPLFVLVLCLFFTGFHVSAADNSELDNILLKIRSYEEGTNDEWMLTLRRAVDAMRQDPASKKACELKLSAFLSEKATPTAKMAVCRHLRMIGTADSVPALKTLLKDDKTADAARYALEKIQGPEAAKALLEAAQGAEGNKLAGLFSSIGARRMREAVPLLKKGLSSPHADVVHAALNSLGNIGTADAAKTILAYLQTAKTHQREAAAGALLDTALRLTPSGERSEDLFSQLMSDTMPPPVRLAAFRGWIVSLPAERAREQIIQILKEKNSLFTEPALDLVPRIFTAETISALLPLFFEMTPSLQVRYLAGLTAFPEKDVRLLAEKALSQTEPPVRIQAMRTLSVIGGPSSVPLLVKIAAESQGEIQAEARLCLSSIPEETVDLTMIKNLLENKEGPLQREYLRAVSERRIAEGKEAALSFLRSPDSSLRREAVRACRTLCVPTDLPVMLDILLEYDRDTDRDNLGSAIAIIAGKETDPLQRGDLVAERFRQSDTIGDRAALLEVLGKIGDDSELPLLRRALSNADPFLKEAAVRALCIWPNDTPLFDVMEIAASTGNKTLRVLSLRGAVRMIGLNPYRSPKEAVQHLKKCLERTERPEEKIAILGVLPTFVSHEALEMALSLENDSQVGKEAALAAEKIRKALEKQP